MSDNNIRRNIVLTLALTCLTLRAETLDVVEDEDTVRKIDIDFKGNKKESPMEYSIDYSKIKDDSTDNKR